MTDNIENNSAGEQEFTASAEAKGIVPEIGSEEDSTDQGMTRREFFGKLGKIGKTAATAGMVGGAVYGMVRGAEAVSNYAADQGNETRGEEGKKVIESGSLTEEMLNEINRDIDYIVDGPGASNLGQTLEGVDYRAYLAGASGEGRAEARELVIQAALARLETKMREKSEEMDGKEYRDHYVPIQ